MKTKFIDFIKTFRKNDEVVEYIAGEQCVSHLNNAIDSKNELELKDKNLDYIKNKEADNKIESKSNPFSFKLSDERKQHVAEKIMENSEIDKLYWIQLVIACMLATLWLLANSIPVIIWSMLVSPILTPIQSFAFAITCGKKHLYMKSLKILLLSILIAIPSSFIICYFVPFAWITEQVLLRGTPTVVDFVVALLSGIIAFIFLWYEKLEESIVGIAIAVSLMPPLASVGIWLHFMEYSVAKWSFLLFITNLVWILVVWILIFFLFWFKPTNKIWKKRTDITLVMVVIFIWLISIPLRKSMLQIADTQATTNLITDISDDYLDSLDEWIVINDLYFRSMDNNVTRIAAKLDVPSDFMFTNLHKDELTKKLAEWLWKSVELDLNIVEISSVYINDENIVEKNILKDVSDYLDKNNILLVDYNVLQDDINYFFFDVYAYSKVDKSQLYNEINKFIGEKYGVWIKIVLQWQDNPELNIVKKSEAEINFEKQFHTILPKAELNKLSFDYVHEIKDDESLEEQATLYLDFKSPYTSYQTKQIISEWKKVIEEYLWMPVKISTKFESFYEIEID